MQPPIAVQLCITVPGAHDGRGWMEKPTNLHISFPKLDTYLQILLTFWHIFHGFKQFLGGYWKHQLKALTFGDSRPFLTRYGYFYIKILVCR